MNQPLRIVTLCTGNVARSVMMAYMLTTLGEQRGYVWHVRSAGTHVVEGSAMSVRTKYALEALSELGEHHYNAHRSHQLTKGDVTWADIILAAEANHVLYVRRHFDEGAAKTVSIAQMVAETSSDERFARRLATNATLEPLVTFDVHDPAGGDQSAYNECASQLWELTQRFAQLWGP